ncbi:uncharacterized protein PGTG_05434 [Puccinia graminis f. sp. tritici CRL 75-36-700-3]|uniref:CxC1-like cysteine cluster associated with KDZ transposases domain-containing protein n=1 Tax=Puccinia graminis f. sp. tritici (strain CRL 75-36-700-3 / race SCCL) TaxID=418459 RepID=E3K4A3_PUCGT|nr:uncharacterized protein PGTG_05434 [Puccinia graminis f. sp. tritici CRL 75-36-700-3]EFP79113.2 hypothetical protein PGTG_05434 [Puccinia graminis f. sp. tritici CRL 75-36-700-3]
MFRQLEEKRKKSIFSVLGLSNQEVLASSSCPACFGPQPPNLSDYTANMRNRLIVCLDGNFQHRHQIKASRNHEKLRTPQFFISQADVDIVSQEIRHQEAQGMTPEQADRCTESHKAADDKRNESTWKGCDDTGLMGCCCRHDAAIYLTNIYKSGEKRHFPMTIIKKLLSDIEPNRQVGILYDIGCTMDKYIDRRQLIPQYRSQLKFGTSVFHAYAHNWLCQLEFHPRFNKGWGLSDGEGLERLWSYLSSLVSPLRYATRNHRLAAISHRVKHHNNRGIKQLPYWLRRKFHQAVKRQQETQSTLTTLLTKRNPHERLDQNFTIDFFKKQWKAQQQFHTEHTEAEMDRRNKLVALYKREATVEYMRERLQGPEIFLVTVAEVRELMDSIVAQSDSLASEIAELTGRMEGGSNRDYEEEKLRLLLWDAKSELFVQAVHIHAERQPLLNSHIMGSHLGTQGKENIIKALQNRRPAVKKIIDTFNGLYEQFQQKYPEQHLSDAHDHPLTYDDFVEWEMDHPFWNDGLYHHMEAPWSIDPDVKTGINCILILRRVQEEFELIAQELARAVGWAIATHSQLTETIAHITTRINLVKSDPNVATDRFDDLSFGVVSRLGKLELVQEELKLSLIDHGKLIEDWNDQVNSLWRQCQPSGNSAQFQQWTELIDKVKVDQSTVFPTLSAFSQPQNDVEDALEEAILGVGLDDGEDADEEWMSEGEEIS